MSPSGAEDPDRTDVHTAISDDTDVHAAITADTPDPRLADRDPDTDIHAAITADTPDPRLTDSDFSTDEHAAITADTLDPSPEATPSAPRWRRPLLLVPLGALLLLVAAYLVDLATAGDAIPRHTTVAGVDLGGLSRAQAQQALSSRVAPAIAAPRPGTADAVSVTVDPASAGVELNLYGTLRAAAAQPHNPWVRLTSLFTDRAVPPTLDVDDAALRQHIEMLATGIDVVFVEGTITITGTTPVAVLPVDGRTLNRSGAADAILAGLATDAATIRLPVTHQAADVTAAAVQQTMTSFAIPALSAPVTLQNVDGAQLDLPVTAIAAALRFTPADDRTLLARVDAAAVVEALGAALDPFVSTPVDASFDTSGPAVAVIAGSSGTQVDTDALAAGLEAVLPKPAPRLTLLPTRIAEPALSAADASSLGIIETVSTASTLLPAGLNPDAVALVVQAVDGSVVRPGGQFSFNTATGPRDATAGYPADGGDAAAAELASPTFGAALLAGLQIDGRTPHQYYDERYPLGLDAVVSASTDLIWSDSAPTGILIRAGAADGVLTVTLWGTKQYDVSTSTAAATDVVDPAEQQEPAGCVPSSGSQGFTVVTTRTMTGLDDGTGPQTDSFSTTYSSAPRIVCERTAQPAPPTRPPATSTSSSTTTSTTSSTTSSTTTPASTTPSTAPTTTTDPTTDPTTTATDTTIPDPTTTAPPPPSPPS